MALLKKLGEIFLCKFFISKIKCRLKSSKKVVQEVIDIFTNAEIQNLPSYKEIEEEFF
jgi:hypothetical protein